MSQGLSDSECSVLTYFSNGLAHKYVNLKEPYNQGIKEQATTKNFFKKKTGFTWNPNPRGIVCRKGFSNSVPYLWC